MFDLDKDLLLDYDIATSVKPTAMSILEKNIIMLSDVPIVSPNLPYLKRNIDVFVIGITYLWLEVSLNT